MELIYWTCNWPSNLVEIRLPKKFSALSIMEIQSRTFLRKSLNKITYQVTLFCEMIFFY